MSEPNSPTTDQPEPGAAAAPDVNAGQQVAGYRLEAQVGQGGMAVVYRAHDVRLDRRVALKLLSPRLAADTSFRARFIRESRAAAAVDHPNIIPVFDAGDAGGALFIAMRYVQGGDVRSLLADEEPLPAAQAWSIVSQVASALDAAHAHGLIHRDVKPANMLLDPAPSGATADPGSGTVSTRHVYLSDFGISKQAMASNLTATGQFVGTLDYIAPEQIEGKPLDGRADQYSLGCAAYEMLTGTPPFRKNDALALIGAHLSEPPPLVTDYRPGLPAAVNGVLARSMAKAPGDRYRNCAEFATELGRALGLLSRPQPLPPPPPPAVSPWPATEIARPGAAGGARLQPPRLPPVPQQVPAEPTIGIAGPGQPGPIRTAAQPAGYAQGWPAGPAGPGAPGAASPSGWPGGQGRPGSASPSGWPGAPGGQAGPGTASPSGWPAAPGALGAPGWPGGPAAQGWGGQPRGPRPRGRMPMVIASMAAVVIVAIAAVVVVKIVRPGSGSGSPTGTSTSSGSSTVSPSLALTQAAAVSKLLSSSAATRSPLQNAVTDVSQCTNLAAAVSQIQTVVNQRSAEYRQARALATSAIRNGTAVKMDLKLALLNSLNADRDYLVWARQKQRVGCVLGSQSADYNAAYAADRKASASKARFVILWDPIAQSYHLPTVTAGSL